VSRGSNESTRVLHAWRPQIARLTSRFWPIATDESRRQPRALPTGAVRPEAVVQDPMRPKRGLAGSCTILLTGLAYSGRYRGGAVRCCSAERRVLS
jgi:hypothetical protein